MSISTADIKLLRESTGAGILDCKKALEETNGDIDQAIEFLRKKGLAAASKKTSREANEGIIRAAVNKAGQVGTVIELNCETDFVARTEEFQALVGTLTRQVMEQPGIDTVEDLLAAPYLEDKDKTVSEILTESIAKLGENILIRRLVRYELDGDGMLESYVHPGERVGVLVEVGGGDPANPKFVELVHDLALQIAAFSPSYVSEEDVPPTVIEAEKDVYRAQLAEDTKKPDHIKERIVDGKLKKWYEDVVLLNQQFIKDNNLTIAQLVDKYSQELGNPLKIHRFTRFELGGI